MFKVQTPAFLFQVHKISFRNWPPTHHSHTTEKEVTPRLDVVPVDFISETVASSIFAGKYSLLLQLPTFVFQTVDSLSLSCDRGAKSTGLTLFAWYKRRGIGNLSSFMSCHLLWNLFALILPAMNWSQEVRIAMCSLSRRRSWSESNVSWVTIGNMKLRLS